MKNYCILFLIFALVSCGFNRIDPAVSTLSIAYVSPKETREVEMAVKLYQHYMASDKSKEYYEVVSKDRGGILNYNPNRELLTICTDPGSGWGMQYKEVDLAKLQWIGDNTISFDLYSEKLTANPNPGYIKPKTNGYP